MSRNLSYSALTLRVKASGESNREAWFLTSEDGLVRATVFGGPKSRLRSLVAPFHGGRLIIYHDPVRDSRKVTDFDVFSYRAGLSLLLERVMTASAVAETIIFSHGGGGNWPEALKLAGDVLDALDIADAEACSRIVVYFFWRWARFLGVGPAVHCVNEAAGGNEAGGACELKADRVLWYSVRKELFFCENCVRCHEQRGGEPFFAVGAGAADWLKKVDYLSPADLAGVTLDAASLKQAKILSQAVIAGVLGRRLSTWDAI